MRDIESLSASNAVTTATATIHLPPLPSAIRYYDDFEDRWHSIRNTRESNTWDLKCDGNSYRIQCDQFGAPYVEIFKHIVVLAFSEYDPTTIALYMCNRQQKKDAAPINVLVDGLAMEPSQFRSHWISNIEPNITHSDANFFKFVMRSLCRLRLGAWSHNWLDYVRQLPSPKQDRYKTVRTGDAFVPLHEQSLIIEYLDNIARESSRGELIDFNTLRDACILVISFQYALRPGQISRIRRHDIRFYENGAVHIVVRLIKKQSSTTRRQEVRRISRSWCVLFVAYNKALNEASRGEERARADSRALYFFRSTPNEVSLSISSLTFQITGEKWSGTDLRHTAAQRLVDAGASHLALAEFMGHSSMITGLVYYDTSPTQALKVNQALAISPIYSSLSEVITTKTVSKSDLLNLPPDNQIGAAPHGIPISGIGACAEGQSLCAKHPGASCYTCSRFLAVRDPNIHRQVAADMRPIVMQFVKSSHSEENSPAFSQLRRMLTAAEKLADYIESQTEGPV